MNFEIKTDLTLMPNKIEFNVEEIKEELSQKLEAYNALVITEDGIKGAKSDRANLNKLKTAIEDKRKEVKKLCLAPYESFEKECKEIVALIEEPIKSIDNQLNVFEEQKLKEKLSNIMAYYNTAVKELKELVPLDKILPSKWKNKTEDVNDLCYAVGDALDRIRTDLKAIKDLKTEFEQSVVDCYLKDLNLSKALAENARLTEQKEKLQKAQQAVTEPPKPVSEPQHTVTASESQRTTTEPQTAQQNEPQYEVSFKVTGSKKQLQLLKMFFEKYEIKYEKI